MDRCAWRKYTRGDKTELKGKEGKKGLFGVDRAFSDLQRTTGAGCPERVGEGRRDLGRKGSRGVPASTYTPAASLVPEPSTCALVDLDGEVSLVSAERVEGGETGGEDKV